MPALSARAHDPLGAALRAERGHCLGAAAIAVAPALAARSDPAANAAPLYGGAALALACAAWLIACRPAVPLTDVRRIATASVIAAHALLGTGLLMLREPFDVSEVASRLQRIERAGHALATVEGTYHAQCAFAGRLERHREMIHPDQVPGWLASHPNGRVVFLYRRLQDIPPGVKVELSMPHRGARLALLAAN